MPKRLLAFMCFVGLALVAAALTTTAHSSTPVTPDRIFVLAGQSNMAGRGKPVPPVSANPRLETWNNGVWQPATDPLDDRRNRDSGVGPGISFGQTVLKLEPSANVGLVMCAVGATSIAEWQPDGVLYQNCLDKVRAIGRPVAATLFLQGESDSRAAPDSQAWGGLFTNYLRAVRHDMGGKVLLGQIGSIDQRKYPYQQVVRDQQAAVAAKFHLPLVTTDDLPISSDGVHFTVPSYKAIGQRFASAWECARRPRCLTRLTRIADER